MPSIKKTIRIALKNPSATFMAVFHQLRKFSQLEYNLKTGWSLCPDFITFIITKRCNYRCARCSAHSPEEIKNNLAKEMNFNDYKKIIDEVAFFKPAIYFCGGEPTLRDDLVKIIKYIKRKKMVCAMTTNASLLSDNLAQQLINSGIDFISISLDGNETIHDKVRGVSGAYQNVLKGISYLKKYRGKNSTPHIKIVGIIDPQNPLASRHVLKASIELDVDEINFGHLMFYTPLVKLDQNKFIKKYKIGSSYITGMETDKPIKIDLPNLKQIVKEIKNTKKIHTSIAQGFNLDLEKYYKYPYQYPNLNSKCFTPWFSAIIRPDGNISPCMEFNVDNIKNRSFLKIWNDPKWKLFRKIKSNKKNIPACFRCGEGQKFIF